MENAQRVLMTKTKKLLPGTFLHFICSESVPQYLFIYFLLSMSSQCSYPIVHKKTHTSVKVKMALSDMSFHFSFSSTKDSSQGYLSCIVLNRFVR